VTPEECPRTKVAFLIHVNMRSRPHTYEVEIRPGRGFSLGFSRGHQIPKGKRGPLKKRGKGGQNEFSDGKKITKGAKSGQHIMRQGITRRAMDS